MSNFSDIASEKILHEIEDLTSALDGTQEIDELDEMQGTDESDEVDEDKD